MKLYNKLKERLLSIGGTTIPEFIGSDDIEIYNLLKSGTVSTPQISKILIRKGTPSKCHRNCCDMYERDISLRIVTGFCLSDNTWYEHSWLLNKSNSLIETTIKRDIYFGYILSRGEETDNFLFNNS